MPHIISTVCPSASDAVGNELFLFDLDHITGSGTTRTISIGLTPNRQRSADKAMAVMDAYIRS